LSYPGNDGVKPAAHVAHAVAGSGGHGIVVDATVELAGVGCEGGEERLYAPVEDEGGRVQWRGHRGQVGLQEKLKRCFTGPDVCVLHAVATAGAMMAGEQEGDMRQVARLVTKRVSAALMSTTMITSPAVAIPRIVRRIASRAAAHAAAVVRA
jgi:hypothetical protein